MCWVRSHGLGRNNKINQEETREAELYERVQTAVLITDLGGCLGY